MRWYLILSIFLALLGAFTLEYQVYKLTELDARCRGLKHPKLWGLFSLGGNNGSGGLVFYLLERKKYPANINKSTQVEMDTRKKKAGVSLAFMAFGTIAMFSILILKL